MKLRLVTVAFDPESGRFPDDPLHDLDGEVVSVVEHFFQHAGRPHLLLLVHYQPPAGERRASAAADERTQLAPHERVTFERLRAWRNGRAEADGVPPYTPLTNKQFVEVVRRRPTTLEALGEIPGLGTARRDRFGADLLAVLAAEPGP